MLGQLLWGTLSDWIGRVQLVILNLIIYMVLAFIVIHLKTGIAFQIVYVFMGLMVATFTSVGNAILKDRYQGQSYIKMMANVGMLMGAGPAMGPLISSTLVHASGQKWQVIFEFMGYLTLLLCLGFALLCRYRTSTSQNTQTHGFQKLMSNIRYWSALMAYGLAFGLLISYLATGPDLIKSYPNLHESYVVYFTISTFSVFIGALGFRIFGTKFSTHAILLTGTTLALAGSCWLLASLYLWPHQVLIAMSAITLMLLGVGLSTPAGKTTTMSQVKQAFGLGASLMKFIQSGLGVIVSAIGAMVFISSHLLPLTVLYAVVSLLSCLFALTVYCLLTTK